MFFFDFLIIDTIMFKKFIFFIFNIIEVLGIFDTFNLIHAKVPILRFKDSLHLLEVDLNFNNCVGIRNTHLLYCYSQSMYF